MGNSICMTCKNCETCTLPKQCQVFECEEFSDGQNSVAFKLNSEELQYLAVENYRTQEQPMARMK